MVGIVRIKESNMTQTIKTNQTTISTMDDSDAPIETTEAWVVHCDDGYDVGYFAGFSGRAPQLAADIADARLWDSEELANKTKCRILGSKIVRVTLS